MTRFVRTPFVTTIAITLALCASAKSASAQITSGRVRPFVTGIIPVVGSRGQVGGVLVDARGAVLAAPPANNGRLRAARQAALMRQGDDIKRKSPLRKISLKRLQQEIARQAGANKPLGQDLVLLAGLQRVEYVFLDPDSKDLILAGPAEGWRVNEQGDYVGVTSGIPVLQLDDLVSALRSTANERAQAISCSIDPSEEGLKRLQRISTRQRPNASRLRTALGPQRISISGIDGGTHFARVMVSADVRMKRLAMNLEKSPVAGLKSYLEIIRESRAAISGHLTPRWWLAPDYQPLERDELGLAWRIQGPGLKVLSKSERLTAAGKIDDNAHQASAARWAADFNKRVPQLCESINAFSQLRGCMDLAMLGALIQAFELDELSECNLNLLLAPKPMQVAKFPAATQVATQASFVQAGRSRIVALSGGVEFSLADRFEAVKEIKSLAKTRRQHLSIPAKRWWWD